MRAFEPPDWRTDVIVVTDLPNQALAQYNCSSKFKRKERTDPSSCVVVDRYVPARMRKEFEEIKDYPFADSVLAVSAPGNASAHYDWLLRADLDTFLTPAFATWSPRRLVVGRGAYCFAGRGTCGRLHGAAGRMGLADAGVDNIGSGWYGPAGVVQECARAAGELMVRLSREEFSAEEKREWARARGWPEWHYGVLSMYAGQLAINACAGPAGFDRRADLLDFPTTEGAEPGAHPHLHTWQGADDTPFSKAAFAAGRYDKVNASALAPLRSVRDYAMWVALVANRKLPPQPLLRLPPPPSTPPPPPSSLASSLLDAAGALAGG